MSGPKLLRKAAQRMRERAKAATPGPWEHDGDDGLVWTQQPIPGDPVSGSNETEDADHIASWHPAVALAVADWLDDVAGRGTSRISYALAVARAYLGGES